MSRRIGCPQPARVQEASLSLGRLSRFLCADEYVPISPGSLLSVGVAIDGADFEWNHRTAESSAPEGNTEAAALVERTSPLQTDVNHLSESDGFMLRDVHINGTAGQLIAIVGAVGAGKSSLLSALLGGASSPSIKRGHSRLFARLSIVLFDFYSCGHPARMLPFCTPINRGVVGRNNQTAGPRRALFAPSRTQTCHYAEGRSRCAGVSRTRRRHRTSSALPYARTSASTRHTTTRATGRW